MLLKDKLSLLLIVILLALALMTLFWSTFNEAIDREEIKLGLDLEGGAHLVYKADFSQLPEDTDKSDAMKGVISVIENRINAYGVNEPVIQKVGEDRILVQLPGIENISEAKSLIGEVALIKFKEQVTDANGNVTWVPATGTLTVKNAEGQDEQVTRELTSQYFKGKVEVAIPQGGPVIYFNWNDDGAKLFEQITRRLLYKPLGIFLGEEFISSPTVQSVITDSGQITGMELDEAKRLAKLLNAGRIDVPLHTIEEHDVSPILGADFVDQSKQAGVVGILLIILFMILYYRVPGVMAGLALLIYAVLVMATFKAWPITLTLAGIAGFILSIGMAVDANVLIFERMREEIRMGRTIRAAAEVGFSRAWPAIRDSNITTLITCLVLYWMGSSLGVPSVQGFAVTLAIGVVLSMFTALVVTKTFMRLLGGRGGRLMDNRSLFLPTNKKLVISREGR
ncbi:MAG: protein translocase subunit SecD [Chloroflexi bacterium]|nr:protein translocase subunit SecD [Chloroflexota bacterium]